MRDAEEELEALREVAVVKLKEDSFIQSVGIIRQNPLIWLLCIVLSVVNAFLG